ncbi:MAG: hypothetical protein ACR2HI_12415 [Gaiella sp.]
MEFLALIHSDQTAWKGRSNEDRESVYDRYGELARVLEAAWSSPVTVEPEGVDAAQSLFGSTWLEPGTPRPGEPTTRCP